MIIKKRTFFIALMLVASVISAQEEDSTDNGFNWMAYPYIFYTPETDLAFGAGGILYFYLTPEYKSKASTITPSFYYSINNQYEIVIMPDLYFGKNEYHIMSDFRFGKFIDKYYGIGNNTPEIENPDYLLYSFKFKIDSEIRFLNAFDLGLIYEFRNVEIIDTKENPYIDDSFGSEGGINSGLGVVISYDSRDKQFYPKQGGLYKFRSVFNMEAIGSTYDFNSIELDARKYTALHDNHILAFQLYLLSKRGNPPFYEMAPLGGEVIMRGYFRGRYRDNNLASGQVEYRTRFGWRKLGLVLFFGAGDVASEYSHYKLTELKYSYGAGLRFRLDEKEKIDVRMDVGFGNNTDGVYFSIQQAF
jgi:hypothetical protein